VADENPGEGHVEERTSAVRIRRPIAVLVGVAAGVAGSTASPASAALTCGKPSERVFLRWLDPLPYNLATNGGFESGAEGWTLSGGAKVVSGNEPFYLHSRSDQFSLSLPKGASPTSPWTCASVDGLVARLVAVASGSPLGTLQVDLLYRNAGGQLKTVGLTAIVAGLHRSWAPTLPIVVATGTLLSDAAGLSLGTVELAFRFRATGGLLTSASWRIDDLYVDPWADKLGW
jgi:hypothetical protein